jgi:GntR family transcriptional regulator
MDIVLNRRGGVPVRDQLVTQLELKILGGTLAHGQRLPSVRSLARRLKVHHNTVSAAYQDLVAAGRVQLLRGSGVFVRGGGPQNLPDARGLDEMIRLALHTAFARGFTGDEIRAAVERWLAAAPPDRVVVVDPSPEMGELLVHEIRQALGMAATSCTIEDVQRDPGRLSGALAVVLPFHLGDLRRLVQGVAMEVLHLELSERERRTIVSLPAGTIALVVSHTQAILPFAQTLLHSIRGDDLVVQTHTLAEGREWRRVARAADVVFADALSVDAVRRVHPRRLGEFRLVSGSALERLREAVTVVVPRGTVRVARAAGDAPEPTGAPK